MSQFIHFEDLEKMLYLVREDKIIIGKFDKRGAFVYRFVTENEINGAYYHIIEAVTIIKGLDNGAIEQLN